MRLIFCDSRDKVSGTSANFTLQLAKPVINTSEEPKRFRIDSLRIPNVFPTISADYFVPNNSLTFRAILVSGDGVAETTYVASLTRGEYNGPDLAVEIQRAMNVAAGDSSYLASAPKYFTVTYNTGTMEMTIELVNYNFFNSFAIDGTVGFGWQLLKPPFTTPKTAIQAIPVVSGFGVLNFTIVTNVTTTDGSVTTTTPTEDGFSRNLTQSATYTGTTLATEIQTQMNLAKSGYTFTAVYNDTAKKITITLTSPANATFRIDASTGYGRRLSPSTAVLSTSVVVAPFITYYRSYLFTYVSRQGMSTLYLSSTTLADGATVGARGKSDTLMQINVTEPYGAVIDRSMPIDLWLPLPKLQTSTLNLTLRDSEYQVLKNIPNVSFTMTID
jgi:hypothetical protein